MEILRTANAGVLLRLDGVSILLDGVCGTLPPYEGIPAELRARLTAEFPDVLAFTHRHEDHYDDAYAQAYQAATLRSPLGPESSLSGQVGNVKIRGVPTRHLGKMDIPHAGFIIEGSQCVWFTGDASPMSWKRLEGLPRPDVAIITYAFAITDSAWRAVQGWGAKEIILLHLPPRHNDAYGLWDAVETTTQMAPCLKIPAVGETIVL